MENQTACAQQRLQKEAFAANAPGRIFKEAFEKIEKLLSFNPAWNNDTGYFDFAVNGEHAPVLEEGEVARFIDTYGRRAIVIGTLYGNVVVFDRYKGQISGGVYATNSPRGVVFSSLVPKGAVGETAMLTLLGSWGDVYRDNIGYTIRHINSELDSYRQMSNQKHSLTA